MPASWPTSDTDVSQLPRWPTASFTLSSADAAVDAPNSVSIAIVQASVFFLIESFQNVLPLYFGLWSFGDPFKRCFAAAAERSPVCGLQNDAFIRADGGTHQLESITFFP